MHQDNVVVGGRACGGGGGGSAERHRQTGSGDVRRVIMGRVFMKIRCSAAVAIYGLKRVCCGKERR
jgi:hypothetical protein